MLAMVLLAAKAHGQTLHATLQSCDKCYTAKRISTTLTIAYGKTENDVDTLIIHTGHRTDYLYLLFRGENASHNNWTGANEYWNRFEYVKSPTAGRTPQNLLYRRDSDQNRFVKVYYTNDERIHIVSVWLVNPTGTTVYFVSE